MKKRFLSILLCFAMAVGLLPAAALAGVATAEDGSISYVPQEQGINSNGGYTIDKISHPDLGAGEVDGILTGADQDRGNSYSWSMADGGEDSDYIYIGTCYNSTFYIYHNNVKTSLNALKKEGKLPDDADTDTMATNIVEVMFGVDKFDETDMSDWDPVIISVHKKTGEAKVIFRERALWAENPTIFPGYSPLLSVKNYLSGYRMVCEFEGKLYFAGMGNPTATLVEVDPATNTAKIAYYNIRYTKGVSNGVHGLMVYDGEILMCLATDDYDGNHTPGGIIMASSNPSDPESWRCIADQDSFDGLPGVMQVDGLNGGGIWDIIEYNGHLYVTIVTDKNIDGKINKQGFAMYRGDKDSKGDFTWTQVIGGKDGSKYGYGLGINYSMSCNLWVYDGYLYLGTYNDPMLDLAEVPASGNFELLYNDLDHSIYLYRMNEDENFEQVGGKADNPNFPDGPIGNLGAGLGNNSNQYVWRMGVHNDELYIGTYDTSTLTYQFTQITDGQVANMSEEELEARADALHKALKETLGKYKNDKLIEQLLDHTVFSGYTAKLYQTFAGFVTDLSANKDPVPEYRQMLEDYESFKKTVYSKIEGLTSQSAQELLISCTADDSAAEDNGFALDSASIVSGFDLFGSIKENLKEKLEAAADTMFACYDEMVYDETIHNLVYYFGCNYYAQQSEPGFDMLVSNDGVNFDAITRDGLGDTSNHGLRCITSTSQGVFLGTANPFYGTQLWLMHSDADQKPTQAPEAPVIAPNGGSFTGSQEVSITCSTEGADIYYTTDGAAPDASSTSSTKYTTSFSISDTCTVKAIAVKDGESSAVVSAAFTKDSSSGGSSSGGGSSSSGGGSGGGGSSSGGGSGGGSGVSSSAYTITVKDAKNGTVTADRKTAASGTTVTLTVKPDQGWTLETLTAANASGKEVDLTIVKVGATYTFKMPSSNVTVTATFMEDNTMLNYFVDVPTDSYYYDAVLWGVEQGITNGTDDSHFDPNGLCTRAQAVTFLWRAAGSPAPKSTAMPFTDVPSGSYYETAVLWAVENGITKGTTDTTFSPDQSCTRGQIVTFLWRAESAPAAGTVDHPFTDVRSDAYYADAVLWAVKEGVTKGTSDTTFSPDDSCTRAQIVTFLWRAMAE